MSPWDLVQSCQIDGALAPVRHARSARSRKRKKKARRISARHSSLQTGRHDRRTSCSLPVPHPTHHPASESSAPRRRRRAFRSRPRIGSRVRRADATWRSLIRPTAIARGGWHRRKLVLVARSAATCGELSREKDRGSTFVTRAARLFDLPCGGHHARTAGSTRGCYYVRADPVVRFSTSVGSSPKTPT